MSLQLAYCRGLRRVAEGLFEAPSNSAVCSARVQSYVDFRESFQALHPEMTANLYQNGSS